MKRGIELSCEWFESPLYAIEDCTMFVHSARHGFLQLRELPCRCLTHLQPPTFLHTSSRTTSSRHIMASLLLASGPPYFVEQDSEHSRSAYHSVSMHPDYRNMSLEELRVQAYNAGQTTTTKPTAKRFPDNFVFSVHPVAGPIHCRKPIRASRDDASYPEEPN
jgi:hypothetical protein